MPDYWGRDLPINKGRYNFDTIKVDYFRDDQVQTEAVKGNAIDVHLENVPQRWATAYDFPPLHRGIFKKDEFTLSKPAGLWWPIFWNLEQKRFQDIRVREALWLMGDFEWGSRRSFHFFGEGLSFFEGSELAARGLPDEAELKLLQPLEGQIPARVFTDAYGPQPNQGSGWHRENFLRADALLKEAGWIVRGWKARPHRDRRTIPHPDGGRFSGAGPSLAGDCAKGGATRYHHQYQGTGNLQLALPDAFGRLRRRRYRFSAGLHPDHAGHQQLPQLGRRSGLQLQLVQSQGSCRGYSDRTPLFRPHLG